MNKTKVQNGKVKKHKFNRKRILVSVESYNPLTEETKHISVWSIDRKHLRSIHKTLRQKFND